MRALAIALLLLLPALGAAEERREGPSVSVVEVTDDLEAPAQIVSLPGSPGRICVVQRTGEVIVIDGASLRDEPLIDISGIIKADKNRGLMAVAFHPDFAANGLLYAYFLDANGDPIVGQFHSAPKAPDEDSMVVTIKFAQSYPNASRGWIAFGPERLLYIGTGDGGDSRATAQSPRSLLGKLLRIAPSDAGGYQAPVDNPLRRVPGALPEVWATGFHSPDSFAFGDSAAKLFVIDTDASGTSRVIAIAPGQTAGNTPAPLYQAERGVRLIGGGIYRGSRIAGLAGRLILAEPSSGKIFSIPTDGTATSREELVSIPKATITAVGVGRGGHIFVATEQGELLKVAPKKPVIGE